MNTSALSIIIPAYNEAARIRHTLDSIVRYQNSGGANFEVIFVDDGSTDGTPDIARSYRLKIKKLKVLVNDENRGKGFSVRRGMLAATGDYRLFMDADNSVDISHAGVFMRTLAEGYDVAIGSIHMSNSNTLEHNGWHRRLLGVAAHMLIRLSAVGGIKDTQRGFKMFSAQAAATIFPRQTIERFGFDIEVLIIARKNGFKIQELPVVWDNPTGSKVTGASYLQTLGELARISCNRILGRYAPHVAHESGVPVIDTTNPVIVQASPSRIRHLIFGPDPDPRFSPIMAGTKQTGFRYKEHEFIHHANLHITESAFFNLLRHQKISLGVCGGVLALAFFIDWRITAITLLGMITALYFFDLLFSAYIIFQSYKILPEIRIGARELSELSDEDCPTYTIFCPLYKEWQVVPQFIAAMQKLDYPHEKLQILFLLEENDAETIEKIRAAALPAHFQTVVVPHSMPKTKPKAMNYGLAYASGEYIVIYDAEDVPESDQLKKAVLAFTKVGKNVACIQAKLNFYNPHQNILTRLFTAEYSLWFDLVLPGLQSISAPIPLGGTSNHFRASTLHQLGGWDAFNVTEDCDLGMRLAKRGYKTAIVDSTTYEEANSDILNWYNQRSRWIKGYIQTYFVHMRNPGEYFRDGKGKDFFFFQLIVGGKILSLFINPLMWVLTICYFLFRAKIGIFIEALFPGPILYMGVFSLIFGNFLYLYYYMVGCTKRGYDELIKYTILVPLYWLGMSLAAWKALYEIVVKPHYWAKTVHGLHLARTAQAAPTPSTTVFAREVAIEGQLARNAIPVTATDAALEEEPRLVRILDDDTRDRKWAWAAKVKEIISSSAGLLVLSAIVANIINFIFNAYLGRVLTLADFGTITMINAFVYILNLFTGALATTATHEVSFLEGTGRGRGKFFFRTTWGYVFLAGSIVCALWILALPAIGNYFNMSSIILLGAFAPAIIFGALDSFNKGYLQGTFSFGSAAVAILFEAVVKLAAAFALVTYGFPALASLAIPGSLFAAWIASSILAVYIYRKTSLANPPPVAKKKFPLGFYIAALVSGVSIVAFLTTDIILAKHYLSPDDAGRYALLSLVGKMLFFFGSLLMVFIMPIVSRAEGQGRSGNREFARLLAGTAILTIGAAGGLAFGGFFFVPLLLGERATAIVQYVPLYSLATALFTLSSTIVVYGLARKRYVFPVVSLAMSMMLWWSIAQRHASIGDFITALVTVNVFAFILICFLYFFYARLALLFRSISDMLGIFKRLPDAPVASPGKTKILIFNWRDRESVFAGGAEIYIHELAERWALAGHAVTLFTSNDGKQKPNGVINGIRIIRRGGFYGVYLLAPLYYLFKFRGRFDTIIDCENGVPFFTPLYAKEPVYCLVFHIHQEVFRKSLLLPMALFASFLEKRLMPLVYRACTFITISESSRRDMQALGITAKNVEVIYPGVDLGFLTPGVKSPTPTVAYIGRLKDYKSVDVLIRAFAGVLAEVPRAELVVAGDGDDMGRLKKEVAALGLKEHVAFLGRISEEEKLQIFREAWVCVNPSMMEGWGITVIEANACGTPVIASDVPGLRDSVRDGRTGLLVPHGAVGLLTEKIVHILTDETLRWMLSQNAIAWAQNFDWQKSSDAFIASVSVVRAAPSTYKVSTA